MYNVCNFTVSAVTYVVALCPAFDLSVLLPFLLLFVSLRLQNYNYLRNIQQKPWHIFWLIIIKLHIVIVFICFPFNLKQYDYV